MIGDTCRIMAMIPTGGEGYRYFFIISEYGIDSIRGGGTVAIKLGGGGMVIMAEDPGTLPHSITM